MTQPTPDAERDGHIKKLFREALVEHETAKAEQAAKDAEEASKAKGKSLFDGLFGG